MEINKTNMKKYLLFSIIALFSVGFISCGDEDEGDEGNDLVELYINNTKQKTYTNPNADIYLNPILYDESKTELSFSALFGDIESGQLIILSFEGISLNDLTVGDDLAAKTTWAEYTLMYGNDIYMLFDNHPVLTNNQYKQHMGQVIVKEFDKNNGTIKVEFSNVKIPTFDAGNPYKQPEKTAAVKAVFSGKIDLL
jgi:hypothetical protein